MDTACTSRSRLLLGTAGAALAVALAAIPQQARAAPSGGAFNAFASIFAGDVSIDRGTPNVDTITVSSPTAVIDWTPYQDNFGNALTFLPNGNTAYFQDAPGQGGFAVLNRILPSTNGNIVAFDGHVVSRLQDISGNFTPGGFVAFYSPTGILVGSTAVFDVGQLLLTTLDVDPFSFDSFYTQGGFLSLSGPFDSTAGVEIQAGATINAPAEGSFFIVAAPQVTMSGAARINGSTAYVAGTSMTFAYANGLFDIAIQQGTSVGNAITHDGSTGGPASTGAGDNHVIYGVAASQVDPILLLFGGNLGFDPAVSATIENGDIILAANYDVSGTTVAGGDVTDPNASFFGGNETGFTRADISILPGTYSSRLTAVGTHDVQATATSGDITFTDDATLIARQTARMLASDGFLLSVGGNARVDASNAGVLASFAEVPSDLDGIGGTTSIAAQTGGRVAITGDALVRADGFAGYDSSSGTGGNGTGGVAEIAGNTGTVDIDGSAIVSAVAGGFNISGLLSSGSFTGGDAHIFAVNGGSVGIDGDVLVEAGANSTELIGLGAQAGGATSGGQAQIGTLGTGGSIVIGGSATLDASAFGQAAGSASLAPGVVTGGQASLFTNTDGMIDIGLDVVLNTSAEGRDNGGGGQGGSAVGGQAIIQSNGTSITIGGGADLDGEAVAGNGGSGAGVRGGDGTGGLASIDASSGTIAVSGLTLLDSNADGGTGGIGGDANAGRSQVVAFGTSSISLGSVVLISFADGGDALDPNGDGGQGNGGESELLTLGTGNISVTDFAELLAIGVGGDGHNGGAATSGLAGAYAITGSIDIGGDFTASASAFGGLATLGFGGQGGDAVGGTAFLQADGTTTVSASLTVGGVATLDASGFGGTGGAGDGVEIAGGSGGLGRGGTFNGTQGSGGVFALAGRDTAILNLGDVTMTSSGIGGAGGAGGSGQAGGAGGDGFGGSAQAGTFIGRGDGSVDGGSASFGALTIFANGLGGVGGAGQTQGTGGDGIGGGAGLFAQGAAVTAGVVEIRGHGAGGSGATGGDGTGGSTGFGVIDGASMILASFLSESIGFGGGGLAGNGGLGTGGDATGDYEGNIDITGDVTFVANGLGGLSTGGAAGAGIGGVAALRGASGSADVGGTLFVNAHGFGGDAQSVDETAGDGTGGSVLASVTGGARMTLGAAQISAGGRGGTGPAATGGNGTGGTAIISADGSESEITILGFAPSGGALAPLDAMLSAFGRGGDTTGGTGVGGTGQGGTAAISVSAGGSISLADDGPGGQSNTVIARALGGNSSVDGGSGGSATGGTSQTEVDNGTLSVGGFVQSSFAQGGSSADSELSITGGNATGGNRIVLVSNDGNLTGALPGGGSGAQGGNGSGGGNGGDATGGINLFSVDGASATLFGPNNFFAGGTGGSGAIGGNVTGGQIIIQFANGADVTMVGTSDGPGTLSAGTVATGGAGVTRGGDAAGDAILISITDSTFSGTIEAVSSAVGGAASSGRGGDAASRGVGFLADNATLTLGGGSLFSAMAVGGDGETGGNAQGSGAGVIIDNGSELTVASGAGGLTVSDEARGGVGTTSGGMATGGSAAFAIQGASTASADLVRVSTVVNSPSGDAVGGSATLLAADNATANFGTVEVEAAANSENPELAGQSRAEVASLSGANLDIGALTIFSSDTFFLGALDGSLTLGNLTARADGTGESQIQAIGGSIPITGTADITVAGDLQITTGQGGIIGGPTTSEPTAIITIEAGGTVSFAGDNDAQIGFGGQELTITSTELDITDGARIGAEFLNLNVRGNDAMTIVGGDTEEAGYTLTQQEVERIEAGEVRFTAFSESASDDVLIRDLTITGSADEGTSSVEIDAGGVVRVEGTLAYIDATADDSLEIFADRLEIVTPGGIGIVDSGGTPTGSFEFYGNDFWMADADTIARLREDVGFAGRDDILASVAQGSDDPLGYLRAGDVEFYIFGGGSLLTRNTGSAATPGGITVTGSLSIETGQSSQPLDVFAYGRLLNPDGSFVTGADFFRLVNFNRTSSGESQAVTYLDASEFNDCIINTSDCGEVVEPPTQEPQAPPIVTNPTTVSGPLSVPLAPTILGPGPAEKNQQFGLFFPGLIQTAPMSEGELIDDPVTSGGDSAMFGSTEQTEGGQAEECELNEDGTDEDNCDDR